MTVPAVGQRPHVLVTGARGYVGSALSAHLRGQLQRGELQSLTLADQVPDRDSTGPTRADGTRIVVGDLGRPEVLADAVATAPDLVFHLSGITSRLAEDDFALGQQSNVLHSIALFDALRAQQRRPRLVYSSSIGVFGTPLPAHIDDDTPPAPTLSYGTQKRMVELLLADHSRRGWIDARSLRLPSIVARPAQPGAALSAFASDLIREPTQGQRYTCPVGMDGRFWLLSLAACVEHLLWAAQLDASTLPPSRAWNLPALQVSTHDVVQALCQRLGCTADDIVDCQPQAALQAQFASWPPLFTDTADRLGFRHDGDLERLLERALAD